MGSHSGGSWPLIGPPEEAGEPADGELRLRDAARKYHGRQERGEKPTLPSEHR
jgi:hypothetical protein